MDSNKIYVRIGRKYKDAFKSICDLVNSGCIDRSIVQSCKNECIIETAQYVFEYIENLETIDTGSEMGILPSGATWFRGFRGGESDSVMGTWHNLLELVATNYHKQYSLVEYIQDSLVQTPQELEAHKDLVYRVLTGLNYKVSDVVLATTEDSTEDIYALSVRVEISSGAGEPKPLLCKIYFRKRNGIFVPIDSEEAMTMDSYISEMVSKRQSAGSSANTASETEIVDNVLNSVSKFIAGEMHLKFADTMVITNETDKENFFSILDNEPGEEVSLECRKLKVLGISHAQWVNPSFYVYIDNEKAFLAKIDLDETLSLSCCCNSPDNKLIERNTISCHSNQTGRTAKFLLDASKINLGLTEDQLKMIFEESAFADHFFNITCSETRKRGVACKKYLCKAKALTFEVNGNTCYKCADCPYPEVIYYDMTGTPQYTQLLHFDSETLNVVEKEPETCRLCGRTYAKENMDEKNFYCKFCASALETAKEGKIAPRYKKTYRLYAGMLPLSLRARNLFNKKFCFENSDRLIFFVGKKKFFFDKLNLTDTGKIKSPEER